MDHEDPKSFSALYTEFTSVAASLAVLPTSLDPRFESHSFWYDGVDGVDGVL